jgi:hydroxymethylglutaryl-CoA lyase
VAVFAAASDAFSRRNINCTVLESLARFKPLMDAAHAHGARVRGYVSCALGCPYAGRIEPEAVGFVAQSLLELGVYEVSLGDTIGVGTPRSTRAMLDAVRRHIPLRNVAVHLHNTYGCALPNMLAALEMGVAVVDSCVPPPPPPPPLPQALAARAARRRSHPARRSPAAPARSSVAGLGGCPYAKGASGNVPTEDVVYMLHGMGIRTNTDLDALVDAGQWMCDLLGRPNASKVAVARLAARAAANADADAADAKACASKAAAALALGWPEPPPDGAGAAAKG